MTRGNLNYFLFCYFSVEIKSEGEYFMPEVPSFYRGHKVRT